MIKKIVDIEEYMTHSVSEVICIKCYNRYMCVRPEKVLLKELECEKCGTGYIIETGEFLR